MNPHTPILKLSPFVTPDIVGHVTIEFTEYMMLSYWRLI